MRNALLLNVIHKEIIRYIPADIIAIAENDDSEIYAVGGCIRNLMLGREIGDIDLSVVGNAPNLAQAVADRLNSGKITIYSRFGTALLRYKGRDYEFATARRESYRSDSRKPDKIEPVSIDIDLRRRDFTVNTLALGLTGPRTGELIDLFGGVIDLDKQLIRTPLEPDVTFSDDPLRMLRGIRFAAEYAFKIESKTWAGIKQNVPRLSIVAAERIGDEIWKMFSGADPVRAMQLLIDSGLINLIIPEVTAMSGVEQVGKHHHKDVLLHSLQVMKHVCERTKDPVVRLAGLLHDVGKPQTKQFVSGQGWTFHGHEVRSARIATKIARRLRLGKDNQRRLTDLIRLHMRPVNLTTDGVTDSAIRRLMVEAGENLNDQLILCRADITTANPRLVDRYLANFDEMARRMADVEARDRLRSFQSPLRGDEIIKICNIQAGPLVGSLKGLIEDAILDGIISYDHEAAKKYLIEIKDEVMKTDPEKLRTESKKRAYRRKRVNREFEFPEDVSENETPES